jgi:NitT/TauT family transport system substrate-binding protein
MGFILINRSDSRRSTRLLLCSTFLLTFTLILASCSPKPTVSTPTPITVQLSWSHQAQFAGFYAADQQGYFADEGLDVTFVEGGPEVDFISPVAKGAAQFGVAQPADAILARAQGLPVRSIAVIYRRSPIVFFSLADSGITRPQDFVGKKIRTAVTVDQTLHAMMTNVGIQPDQYEPVFLPSDIQQFATGDVPVWGGYINVLVVEVQRAGYEINIISPDDYGIHFYGDVLITTDDVITKQPDLVRRFLRATLKGWKYALEHPEMIGSFVQKYKPDADPAVEVDKMIRSIPLVNTGEDNIGWMTADRWKAMGDILREQGALIGSLDIQQVYTMQFLKEIYGK